MELIRPLVTYKPYKDNSILTEAIPTQDYSDPNERQRIHEILEANCIHYKGLGIAANQLNMKERAFYLDGKTYFNPVVLEYLEMGKPFSEGCLSFFSTNALVTRHSRIKVAYINLDGGTVEEVLEGLAAIAYQHEMDHLDGITMADRIKANLSKKRFLDKVKKNRRTMSR